MQNGKGDSPRNCFSGNYKKNYDSIFRKKKKNITKEQEFEILSKALDEASKRVSKRLTKKK